MGCCFECTQVHLLSFFSFSLYSFDYLNFNTPLQWDGSMAVIFGHRRNRFISRVRSNMWEDRHRGKAWRGEVCN